MKLLPLVQPSRVPCLPVKLKMCCCSMLLPCHLVLKQWVAYPQSLLNRIQPSLQGNRKCFQLHPITSPLSKYTCCKVKGQWQRITGRSAVFTLTGFHLHQGAFLKLKLHSI